MLSQVCKFSNWLLWQVKWPSWHTDPVRVKLLKPIPVNRPHLLQKWVGGTVAVQWVLHNGPGSGGATWTTLAKECLDTVPACYERLQWKIVGITVSWSGPVSWPTQYDGAWSGLQLDCAPVFTELLSRYPSLKTLALTDRGSPFKGMFGALDTSRVRTTELVSLTLRDGIMQSLTLPFLMNSLGSSTTLTDLDLSIGFGYLREIPDAAVTQVFQLSTVRTLRWRVEDFMGTDRGKTMDFVRHFCVNVETLTLCARQGHVFYPISVLEDTVPEFVQARRHTLVDLKLVNLSRSMRIDIERVNMPGLTRLEVLGESTPPSH
jgi:hypothetical protein